RIGSTPGKKPGAVKNGLSRSSVTSEGNWGIPVVWISDRDKPLVQGFWKVLSTALRTKAPIHGAYNPQADGQSERSNKQAKSGYATGRISTRKRIGTKVSRQCKPH
ncbi:hypothetical protein PDIDSM_4974, partial [Penicillium digitatum]